MAHETKQSPPSPGEERHRFDNRSETPSGDEGSKEHSLHAEDSFHTEGDPPSSETHENSTWTHDDNQEHRAFVSNVQRDDVPPNDVPPKNDSAIQNSSERDTLRFIIGAIASAIVIVAVVIGVGWALFYPKGTVEDTSSTSSVTSEESSTTNGENTHRDENGDVVIIYGEDDLAPEEPAAAETDPQKTTVPSTVEKPRSPRTPLSSAEVTPSVTRSEKKEAAPPRSTKKKKRPRRSVSPATEAHSESATPVAATPRKHPKNSAQPLPTSTKKKEGARAIVPEASESAPTDKKVTPPVVDASKPPSPAPSPSRTGSKTAVRPIASSKGVPTERETVFWVQIFSTNNRNKADILKTMLGDRGIPVSISMRSVNDILFYRLRVGPYYNENESKKFLRWVRTTKEYSDAYVTRVFI